MRYVQVRSCTKNTCQESTYIRTYALYVFVCMCMCVPLKECIPVCCICSASLQCNFTDRDITNELNISSTLAIQQGRCLNSYSSPYNTPVPSLSLPCPPSTNLFLKLPRMPEEVVCLRCCSPHSDWMCSCSAAMVMACSCVTGSNPSTIIF